LESRPWPVSRAPRQFAASACVLFSGAAGPANAVNKVAGRWRHQSDHVHEIAPKLRVLGIDALQLARIVGLALVDQIGIDGHAAAQLAEAPGQVVEIEPGRLAGREIDEGT